MKSFYQKGQSEIIIMVAAVVIIGFAIYGCIALYQNHPGNNYQKKTYCIAAAEQYYANFLISQEHNSMFSFDTMDISHQSGYSSTLNTTVPTGMRPIGIRLPTSIGADADVIISLPTFISRDART